MPPFVADFEGVGALDMRQHIAPVIAVLHIIAQRKAVSKANAQPGDIDHGHREQAGRWRKPFDSAVPEEPLVERVGREGVSFASLQRKRIVVVRRIKCRPNRGAAGADRVAVKQTIYSVLVEILIDADTVLLGVVVTRRVEVTLIEDWRGTGDVVRAGGCAPRVCSQVLSPELLHRVLKNVPEGRIGGWIFA